MSDVLVVVRVAVFGAMATSLWFNASIAYAKAPTPFDQAAMVALALTIDCCKCGFLRASSACWQRRNWLPAALLFALWWPCLAYSTFQGYESLTTNRSAATASAEGQTQQRRRAQKVYDDATADLATAKAAPQWTQSAACTTPKPATQAFCDRVARRLADQERATEQLNRLSPVAANPALDAIQSLTGWPAARIAVATALFPALLIELLASVGYYALGHLGRRAQKASGGNSRLMAGWRAFRAQKPSDARPDDSEALPPTVAAAPASRRAATTSWSVPVSRGT